MKQLKSLVLCGVGLALLLAALRFLDQHPLPIGGPAEQRERPGGLPERSDRGDVLVLLGGAALAGAPAPLRPDETDFSCAWLNLIGAEFGPVGVEVDPAAFRADCGARAVVVTSSAHAAAPVAELAAFAESGGAVLIDGSPAHRPAPAELLALAGAVRSGGGTPQFDVPELDGLGPEARAAFASSPHPLPLRREVLVDRAGGSPRLFVERALGSGRAVAASVDVAEWYTAMVQGRPAGDDWRLSEVLGDYPDIFEPDDLVRDPRLRSNEVPFADLLAHSIAALLDPRSTEGLPLPRLMWWPAGASGTFLMTHDEDFRGGAKSRWLVEWDRQLGVAGTVFAISHPRLREDWLEPEDFATAIRDLGGAVGLHWNRFRMPKGIGRIEPVEYEMSCSEQAERLRALSPATREFRTNRNHYLIVGDDWSETFRILAAEGVRLDSTFGANKGRGYLFGTARPYLLLDNRALPLPVLELPFQNQEDWGGADRDYFTRLLEDNARQHHGAIVALFHPHLIVQEPAGKALFEHVARTAMATGHAPMTAEQFLDFHDGRAGARLRSRAGPGAGTLEIEVEVARAGYALCWPWPSGPLPSAASAGAPLEVAAVDVGGVRHAVVAVPAGRARIEVQRR